MFLKCLKVLSLTILLAFGGYNSVFAVFDPIEITSKDNNVYTIYPL